MLGADREINLRPLHICLHQLRNRIFSAALSDLHDDEVFIVGCKENDAHAFDISRTGAHRSVRKPR